MNRSIYFSYRDFSKQPIPTPVTPSEQQIQGKDAELLKFILDHYVNQSAVALSAMTHKEIPWKDNPDQVIPDQIIRDYYFKQSLCKELLGEILEVMEIFHHENQFMVFIHNGYDRRKG